MSYEVTKGPGRVGGGLPGMFNRLFQECLMKRQRLSYFLFPVCFCLIFFLSFSVSVFLSLCVCLSICLSVSDLFLIFCF